MVAMSRSPATFRPSAIDRAPARAAGPFGRRASLQASGQWARALFATADFGDSRLQSRAVQIVETLAAAPNDTIPQACGKWPETKAAYRFIENRRVSPESIHEPVGDQAARACVGEKVVLAVQDTTTLVFPNAYDTPQLGPVNSTAAKGLLLHSTLALREDGVAIGLLDQHSWTRAPKVPGSKKKPRINPAKEKESARWLESARNAHRRVETSPAEGERPRLIHVCDREGDIYEMLHGIVVELGDGAVIRSKHNRRVDAERGVGGYAHDSICAEWPLGSFTVEVPRKPGKPAREATVEIRAQRQTLPAGPSRRGCKDIALTLLEVWEPDPPEGQEALRWLLWTTEPVKTFAEALRVVEIYKLRWRIEDFHKVLKSGCQIEKVRFHTVERIRKAIALYSPVAVRILALRDLARREPEAPATRVLSDLEWRTLHTYIHEKPPAPDAAPPSLRQATLWVGRLGGHIGRKGDGMPGVKTLWRGWRDLELLVHYASFHS